MKFAASFRHVVGTLSRFSTVLFLKSVAGRVPGCRWALALLWLAALVPVRATEFYASPTGSGAGTLAAPMALTTAFSSSAIKPGDTLWLRGGTYQVGGKSFRWQPTISGTASAYITVRNYNNERAILDGPLVRNAGLGGYVRFWGLEVTCSLPGRITTQTGSWPTTWQLPDGLGKVTEYCISGLYAAAPYDKFINCYVHDVIGGGVGVWTSGPGVELSGNLITQNGWVAPDRSHGHGIYAQNSLANPRRLVQDNIMLNDADHGAQFYGSVDVCNFDIVGNVFADNGVLYTNITGGGANVLVGGGSISSNNTFVSNLMYRTPGSKGDGYGDHYQGYDQNTVGLVNSNNLVVSKSIFNVGTDSKVTGNTYYGPIQWGHGMSSATFPNNTYSTTVPTTGTIVSLRKNAYDTGRANLVIYNFAKAGTVTVDLSNLGLKAGDTLELHNGQDYFGDVRTFTYTSGGIVVPMTGHTTAKPIDAPNPASTFPAFGAFILVKTGSGLGTANAAPTISSIANQTVTANTTDGPLPITVSDAQMTPSSLALTADSSNVALVPNSAIVLGGSGASRTVTVTPAANQTGGAAIRISVTDGVLVSDTTFTLTVNPVTATNTAPVTLSGTSPNLKLTGTNVVLTFPTVSNRHYYVQTRTNLVSGSWSTIATNITGTGGVMTSIHVGAGTERARFYRVGQASL